MKLTLPLGELRPGDYVVPARCTVVAVDSFRGLAIVDFSDGTASPPLSSGMEVEVIRSLPPGEQSSAVVTSHHHHE